MNYKNGEFVFPADILSLIQDYAEGELVYIPRKDNKRKNWGEASGTRSMLKERNTEICRLYSQGMKPLELAEKYYLSEDSIRKIIRTGNGHVSGNK